MKNIEKPRPSLPRSHAQCLVLASYQEGCAMVLQPRSSAEWGLLGLEALSFIPGCAVVAEIASLGSAIMRGNWRAVGAALLRALPYEAMPFGRLALLVLRTMRRLRKIAAAARVADRVMARASLASGLAV